VFLFSLSRIKVEKQRSYVVFVFLAWKKIEEKYIVAWLENLPVVSSQGFLDNFSIVDFSRSKAGWFRREFFLKRTDEPFITLESINNILG
jgi:hypothetical protein